MYPRTGIQTAQMAPRLKAPSTKWPTPGKMSEISTAAARNPDPGHSLPVGTVIVRIVGHRVRSR